MAEALPLVPTTSSLEDLPTEIRRLLISNLNLDSLRSLVHASPAFHQQYRLNRRFMLRACLEMELQQASVDAYAVHRSSSKTFSLTRSKDNVASLLCSYDERRSYSQTVLSKDIHTEDEAVDMASFHRTVVRPIARHYVKWALEQLASHVGTSGPSMCTPTEKTRLTRALYRFQLCCNLFGVGPHEDSRPTRLRIEPDEILSMFFAMFEPWEVEEIYCIYAFAKDKYNQIFTDIRWDVNEENPKFDGQRPPTPEGSFDFDNSWVRSSLLKGTISRGLGVLRNALLKVEDHSQLVSAMQEHIAWPAGYFLENEALGETAQHTRREAQLSERDLKQQRREPLLFTDEDESEPPLAWTLMWQGTYSNLYGHYVEDEIRRWGYVMWDAARLRSTGGDELLKRQVEADWGGYDPRDQM